MKKSTLITTIAMVVVVVVALSTATYAWFSSQQATYANISIEIDPDTGLTVLVNGSNIYSTSDSADFNAISFLPNPGYGSNSGIRAGIWTPNQSTALALTPNDDGIDNITLGTSQVATTFIEGTLEKTTGLVKTLNTMQMSPDIINVENNTNGAKYVQLTIYIGYAADNASRYAASGVAAYVAGTDGVIAETDYYLPNETINTANSTSVPNAMFAKHASTHTFTDSSIYPESGTPKTKGNHIASINDIATTGVTGASAAGIDLENCYTLKAMLGQLQQGESANYLVYNWLDGGYLTDNAKGCSLKIVYAFTPNETNAIV